MEDDHGAPDAGPALEVNEAHGETTATHAAEEEAGGMPQLNPDFFGNQIFWLIVALAAIFLILSRIALPRIGATLATRQGTIGSDLAAAEALRTQASDARAAYDKALADARAEAGRIGAQARAEIQAQLDAELAQADARIEAKAAQSAQALRQIEAEAAGSVETVARDAARAILEVLGGQPDPVAVDAAIDRQTRS
jgi:F-type H+-transporting ATPase subunit b